ncbi:probable calcium-binding protein CML25 [Macadamia integrifolia]|uniref:probable calcium-binding protein CML25 n=1 Tax=Macadamia integrifolia TaxID=60698 RepID=UPI001C4FD37C|nr:probable calcium-binding protein CML25 [Macadamia integrifolia]
MGIKSFLARRKKSSSKSQSQSQSESPAGSSNESRSGPLSFTQARTQIEELEDVFKKFDVNGDGKISSSELGAIMGSLGHPTTEDELEKMIKEVDSDGDGYIDLNEFIELNTKGVDTVKVLEDLRNAFLIYDIDRNGSISPEELQTVLRSLGEETSLAECRKMISGVDCDGDGLINFEEFKIMMTGSSEDSSSK